MHSFRGSYFLCSVYLYHHHHYHHPHHHYHHPHPHLLTIIITIIIIIITIAIPTVLGPQPFHTPQAIVLRCEGVQSE